MSVITEEEMAERPQKNIDTRTHIKHITTSTCVSLWLFHSLSLFLGVIAESWMSAPVTSFPAS